MSCHVCRAGGSRGVEQRLVFVETAIFSRIVIIVKYPQLRKRIYDSFEVKSTENVEQWLTFIETAIFSRLVKSELPVAAVSDAS